MEMKNYRLRNDHVDLVMANLSRLTIARVVNLLGKIFSNPN